MPDDRCDKCDAQCDWLFECVLVCVCVCLGVCVSNYDGRDNDSVAAVVAVGRDIATDGQAVENRIEKWYSEE